MQMRSQRSWRSRSVLVVVSAALSLLGCVEFNTDGPYICRNQTECGDDGKFECRRGAECYCICAEIGTTDPQFQNNCEDPNCQNVRTQ